MKSCLELPEHFCISDSRPTTVGRGSPQSVSGPTNQRNRISLCSSPERESHTVIAALETMIRRGVLTVKNMVRCNLPDWTTLTGDLISDSADVR